MKDSSLLTINVLKASGEREPFSEEKVRQSLSRAGLKAADEEKVIARLKEHLYEGITTKEIYAFVRQLLRKIAPPAGARYDLKKAIIELGPTGYPFERFIRGVLQYAGFQVAGSTVIKGRCVSHEVDFLAFDQSRKERFLGECKFHHQQGIKTNVKVALYVEARFLDLSETKINFFHHQPPTAAFLVTNTKLTSRAIAYGQCVGMKMVSWNYPEEDSLRTMIERERLHPITCLVSLNKEEKQALLREDIVFCRQLEKKASWRSLVAKEKREKVAAEAAAVVEGKNG